MSCEENEFWTWISSGGSKLRSGVRWRLSEASNLWGFESSSLQYSVWVEKKEESRKEREKKEGLLGAASLQYSLSLSSSKEVFSEIRRRRVVCRRVARTQSWEWELDSSIFFMRRLGEEEREKREKAWGGREKEEKERRKEEEEKRNGLPMVF